MSGSCCLTKPILPITLPLSKYLIPEQISIPSTSTRKNLFTSFSSYKPSHLIRCCSKDPSVVVDDNKYVNKQVISLTPRLYDYILSNVREPDVLRELREKTATMHGSKMQVSPDQAQLLSMLVQILGATRCIEIGVYTGYSSLAVALALPESGHLVACERDDKALEVSMSKLGFFIRCRSNTGLQWIL